MGIYLVTERFKNRLNAMCLMFIDSHTHASIADVLGISAAKVARTLSLPVAREQIAKLIAKREETVFDPVKKMLMDAEKGAMEEYIALSQTTDNESIKARTLEHILALCGRVPKKDSKEDEGPPRIIVGNMNVQINAGGEENARLDGSGTPEQDRALANVDGESDWTENWFDQGNSERADERRGGERSKRGASVGQDAPGSDLGVQQENERDERKRIEVRGEVTDAVLVGEVLESSS